MPDNKLRTFLMSIRQALIIALGAFEDYLGMERSIVPRRKRGRQQQRLVEDNNGAEPHIQDE